MSIDTNLSVGPYLIAKGQKIIEIEQSIFTCSDINCIVNKKNIVKKEKHCSECGSPITIKDYSVDKIIKASDFRIEYEYEDELCYTGTGNGNIFVPNCRSPFRKSSDEVIDLTDVNIQEEIDWFKEKYKKIIDYIIQEFGEESVDIKFGVIQWYS